MPIQSNDSSAKLALWNDEVFSCVWIAGTNVKQYARQAEKIDRELGIKTICEFVSKLVIHRTMPLDVNAKIVCGMSQIYLFNVKALHRSLQAVNEKDVRSRVDYNEKKIVRQFQQNITCKPGKDGWLPDPMDLEQLMNFELDNFMNQITEKEVIDCLLASQKNTTVQHIHDITLREMPDTTFPYSASNWQVEDDDFGTAEPNEMIDFFYPKVESNTTSSQLQPEHPIQLDQEHNLSVLNVVDCTYNDVASLGNTLPPLPVENDLTAVTEENATVEPSTTSAVKQVPSIDKHATRDTR
uniref:Uncharacterized protein n=1 Tax=Anopheles dirus TaxID=7168 RepID=A0A182NB84_9DIPT